MSQVFKHSDVTAFAFTCKDNHTDPNYDKFFESLEKNNCTIETKIKELDSKGKEHWHGIALIPKYCFRKRLCSGYHVKFDELYDRDGWMRYITKDLKDFEEILHMVEEPDIDIEDDGFTMPTKKLFSNNDDIQDAKKAKSKEDQKTKVKKKVSSK